MKRRHMFGATIWDLTEAFFEAHREYDEVFNLYERRVLQHAEEQGVDRRRLRLDANAVSQLLDFAKLGHLRNQPLARAKEVSHSLFRSEGRTHKFDRFVSEIFHEISILREEQYKVSTFAEEYRRENELDLYESILDEVHEEFPRRVHHLRNVFQRAQTSLEGILRAHSRDPIYLRSLVLFGDETLSAAYRDGVSDHCWRVYDRGPAEAFLLAARSFAQSGFKAEALAALDRALAASRAAPPDDARRTDLSGVLAGVEELRGLVGRLPAAELVRLDLAPTVALHGDSLSPELLEDDVAPDEPAAVGEQSLHEA